MKNQPNIFLLKIWIKFIKGVWYEKIKKIADKYNKYKFKIFGSRARGDYRSNSDIDIAIEGNIDKKDKFNIVNEFDMIDMVYTMDIVFIEDITKKEFLDSILKEGINLWIDLFKEKMIMKMLLKD